MFAFVWSALAGWIAVLALVLVSLLPFALRRLRVAGKTRRNAMRAHYILGFAVLGFSLIHASSPMSAGLMRSSDQMGLWIATFALVGLIVQLALGIELRAAPVATGLRRSHFLVMLAAVGLIAGHVALDLA